MDFYEACISIKFGLEVTVGYVILIFHILKGTLGPCIFIALQNGIRMGGELRRKGQVWKRSLIRIYRVSPFGTPSVPNLSPIAGEEKLDLYSGNLRRLCTEKFCPNLRYIFLKDTA